MARYSAWCSAYLNAVAQHDPKKFPSFSEFVGETGRQQKSPAMQRAAWHDWAIARGIKIERVPRPAVVNG